MPNSNSASSSLSIDLTAVSDEYVKQTKLFNNYVCELKCTKFTEPKKNTLKQYISHLEKIHIDFLHGVIQKQDLVHSKNEEIIKLQRELAQLKSSVAENENNTVIDNLKDEILAKNDVTSKTFGDELKLEDFPSIDLDEESGPWITVETKRRPKIERPVTYSDVTRKSVAQLKIPSITKGRKTAPSLSSHVLLLENEQKVAQMDNETFKKAKDKIKNTLDAKSKNLRINNIAPTKTGGVLINCSSEEDLNQAKTILDNNAAELKLTPKYPSKKLPKISIGKIDSSIPDNQIKNVILEQNEKIREHLENSNEVFDFVFAKSDGIFTKRAIFTCSPSMRSLIMMDEFLYIECSRCIVSDNLFIHQCLHCAGFGHTEKFCSKKTTSKVICTFCSENHRVSDCPYKKEGVKHFCANCSKSNRTEIKEGANSHCSSDKSCPVYIQELIKLTLKTDYGCDFVRM